MLRRASDRHGGRGARPASAVARGRSCAGTGGRRLRQRRPDTRFDLQKEGYAAAFRTRQVLDAIRSGPTQSIAVTMVQWTGPTLHIQVVPWMRIGDVNSAEAFANAIVAAPRQLFGGGTSISGVIDYAMTLWRESPYTPLRRVIDISGDGANNRGRPASFARDEAVRAGVGINGLPILALDPGLDFYYEADVIGGPGAFVVAAQNYDTFAAAILRKLITEISINTGATRVSGPDPRHARAVRRR